MNACAMKASSDRSLKPVRKSFNTGWTHKQSIRKYSTYIYKIEKELCVDASDSVSLLRLRDDVHAQVGIEAARLSKLNRRRVITQRELYAAAVRAHQDMCA